MSERKVLNKYYPPDFDPSKIPRMKLSKNRQYTVRLMAPFNMRCVTCGEYIYKGKKFNARKEDVEDQDYLGIRIYRFYIKCTRCLQEISFKTDPKNTDYEIEAGATRNFMALKLAEEQAQREHDEQEEEVANNPMKLLESRTEASRQEIELLESLEELKDLNRRQQDVDYDSMLSLYHKETEAEKLEREQREDEEIIKSMKFAKPTKRIVSEEIIEEVDKADIPPTKLSKLTAASSSSESSNAESTELLTQDDKILDKVDSTVKIVKPEVKKVMNSWNRSVGGLTKKTSLAGLVRTVKRAPEITNSDPTKALSNDAKICEKSNFQGKEIGDDSQETISSAVKATGLSLLSGYSDSESNSDGSLSPR